GAWKDLEAAIDRSQADNRRYSPLLISAARQAPGQEVWVVTGGDPDRYAIPFAKLADEVAESKTAPEASAPPAAVAPAAVPPAIAALPVQTLSRPATPPQMEAAKIVATAKIEPPKVEAVKPEIAKIEPAKAEPLVIRIYGLEGGTKEIVLPKKDPQ
ncbi:MAG TPA: hypothetical protein VKS01_02625, partial [Bryobacteraceae bacterium]|nr:hypothetical protein [Bryobacteraceae bacterium]